MFEEYSGICGMTEAEICDNFQPELQSVAARHQISEEKFLQELGRMYDGYHFFPGSPGIYNPFSVLNALSKKELSNFWFSTGTPTFLVRRLKNMHFDVRQFAGQEIFVYIFEFKVDKSAKEALEQIEAKGYAAPFKADQRQIFKIGVNFDSEARSLSEWLVG